MKVEKKLEIFTQVTMSKVEEKRRQITREMGEAFNGTVDEAVRTAEKQSRERLRTERYKIDTLKNKQIVTASADAKRLLIALRDRLTEDLFADVKADVRAFTKSPDYEAWLSDNIRKSLSASSGGYAYVQIMRRDTPLADKIAKTTGLKVEVTDEDFIGGFRLITASHRAISDHTLAKRIQEERGNFSMMSNHDMWHEEK